MKKRLRKIKNITPNVPPMDIAPRPVTVGFPFINESVYSEFRKLLNKFDITLVPKINNKLNDLIILGKDKWKPGEKTGVVYLEKCLDCSAVYAGATKREHKVRHMEHMKMKNKTAEISIHMKSLNHTFDESCYIILDTEKSWFKARVSESLHINFLGKNAINVQKDVYRLNNEYKDIISAFRE